MVFFCCCWVVWAVCIFLKLGPVGRIICIHFLPFFCSFVCSFLCFPGGSDGKASACNPGRPGFDPWMGKIPWRRKWQPTPVFLPRKSQRQWSLAGYCPWGCKRVRHDLLTKQQQHEDERGKEKSRLIFKKWEGWEKKTKYMSSCDLLYNCEFYSYGF